MHPILFSRGRLVLYLFAWILVAFMLGGLSVRSSDLQWGQALVISIPMALVYAFVCLTSFYLCRAFPIHKTGYARMFGVFAVSAFLSSGLWIMAVKAWAALLGSLAGFPGLTGSNENVVHLFFLNGILLFLLTVFMHYLLLAVGESKAREKQALEQSVLAREAELRALRAQIQPHFLFNSLNSISALTTADATRARDMSLRLAEFLRKTLRVGSSERIPFSDEIALAENYLTIEKTRFGNRLNFTKEIDNRVNSLLIPPLILQPLVENAVNHGISPLPEGGTIHLQAKVNGEFLRITVENPRDPDYVPAKKGGIGLDNVKRRLAATHGEKGIFKATDSGDRYLVELSIPVNETTG